MGVNFGRLFAHSPYAPEVNALYRQAHLNVRDDLATLTAHANIRADQNAIRLPCGDQFGCEPS